jgi:hypothetical protein
MEQLAVIIYHDVDRLTNENARKLEENPGQILGEMSVLPSTRLIDIANSLIPIMAEKNIHTFVCGIMKYGTRITVGEKRLAATAPGFSFLEKVVEIIIPNDIYIPDSDKLTIENMDILFSTPANSTERMIIYELNPIQIHVYKFQSGLSLFTEYF